MKLVVEYNSEGRSAVTAVLIVLAIAATAAPVHADAQTAEDLYAQGKVAYDHGDWTTAIERWRASYQLSGEVGLLFNLAQAERQSGDCQGAIAAYRRYLAADADEASEQHKLAEDLARELESKCSAAAPPKTAPATDLRPRSGGQLNSAGGLNDPEDRADRGRTLKIAGIATAGSGIALVTTGLIYGHRAQSIGADVTNACSVSCDWAAWKDKDAEGRRDATIGRVLDGVGIAGIVGGAVLYYVGVRRSTVTVSPRGGDGGAVVSWSGSW